jgi:hypothetical protein
MAGTQGPVSRAARIRSTDRAEIGGQELRIIDGAVVVQLAPTIGLETENAGGADNQVDGRTGGSEMAAFATDGEEQLWRGVERIVDELDLNDGWAREDALVDGTNVFPAAADAPNRIIERSLGSRVPVLLHVREIAPVEGTVELRKSEQRVSGIFDGFPAR